MTRTQTRPTRPHPAAPVAIAVAVWLAAMAAPNAATAQAEFVPQIAGEREVVADPPGRAGRLSEVMGSAWLFHPDAGEWLAAERNRPFTSGDRLSTDAGGRAELRVGSTALRLDGDTELQITRLDDERFEVYLHSGSLAVRLRSDEAAREFAITTDQGRFVLQRAGRLRLDRRDDQSVLTVHSGQAQYETPAHALTVPPGQRAEFWLDASGRPQYQFTQPQFDRFAGWAAELDRADAPALAQRYVSPEMTGAEDLDRYGRWEQDPEYGALWTPREVPVGWAPYAQGHWAWVAPWGWTWVDAQPWGFAPFHYGRWVYLRERWCWTPGRYVARPVYAPALVGWVGGGGASLSVSIGGGPAVGWFPLAPGEAWFPRHRVSPRYVRVVNGPSFRNGAEIDRWIINPSNAMRGVEFRNRKFHHGTTLVPASAFTQPSRFTPVNPRWRGDQFARDLDRLPASPFTTVAPPAWRRGGPDGRPGGWTPDDRSGWRRDNLPGRGPAPGNGYSAGTGGALPGGGFGTPAPAGGFGGAATAPRERPIDPRPGDRPFFGNGERPVERPVERPTEPRVERPVDRPVERPIERPFERPFERSFERPGDRPADRGFPRPDGNGNGNSEWPSGRSRPVLPPGTLPEPRPMPPAVVMPAPLPAPNARVDAEPEPRFNRPDRRFERPERGIERAPGMIQNEAPRAAPPMVQAPPVMRPAPVAPPPMPMPAPPPMAAPAQRAPEPARAAAPPPSSYVAPQQSRRPGEMREPAPVEREGGRGGTPN